MMHELLFDANNNCIRGKEMAEIFILHLSDLHISGSSLSSTHKKLIDDIEDQTRDMEGLVIISSGDTIDKGNYKKNYEGVKIFFLG